MASLSQTTQTTRTFLKWVGILFAIFLLIRIVLFPLGKAMFQVFFPKEPTAPTTEFGILPRIPFPQGTSSQGLTFTVQTTTGQLPPTCAHNTCTPNQDPTQPINIPDRLNVYQEATTSATFSSYDSAKRKVTNMGFTGEETAISEILFQWNHSKAQNKQITFNTTTESFTIKTTIATSSGEFTQPPPSATQAIRIAKDFLARISLLPEDIDDAKTSTTFLRFRNGNFEETTSLSLSDVIQIDFYRKPVSDLFILYPNPEQSLLSFRVKTHIDRDLQIVEAHYAYKQIDTSQPTTYPIKTPTEAFEELQLGEGYIAKNVTPRGPIGITKVYTAYYEGNDDVPYILPIFVFEGEGFLAFVEAVRSEWLE